QAEDGIRYWSVTGVQTCALPISSWFSVNAGLEAFVNTLTNSSVDSLTISASSPAILYFAAFSVGVFKTIDGGLNWSAASNGLTEIGRASCRERVEISWSAVAVER